MAIFCEIYMYMLVYMYCIGEVIYRYVKMPSVKMNALSENFNKILGSYES